MPSRSPAIVGLLPAPFQEPSCLTTLIRSRTRPSAPSPVAFYARGSSLVVADYLDRPQPPGISSGWIVLTARRQLPRGRSPILSATPALLGERRTPATRSMYMIVLLFSAHSLAS